MKILIALLAVAGCAHEAPPQPAALVIPDEARSCPHTALAPETPPTVRTIARLAKFAVDLELSREASVRDLAECDRRRELLLRTLEAQ